MGEIILSPAQSIGEALKNAKPHTRLVLAAGEYREKLEITVPDIEIVGQGADKTKIVWGDYAKKLDEKGVGFNTFRTYTAAVLADGVSFKDLSVVNDSGSPEVKGQEVALTVLGDRFEACECGFVSTQDTVFCGPLPDDLIKRYEGFLKDSLRASGRMRQVFKNCLVAGNVDFIFGCGDALFDGCEIRSVFDKRGGGFAAAPAHAAEQDIGIVFNKCAFTCEESVGDGTVYLARPWRDFGKCSFIGCGYGRHIKAEGFDKWNDTDRDKTARFAEDGMKPEGRVSWSGALDEKECRRLLSFFSEVRA